MTQLATQTDAQAPAVQPQGPWSRWGLTRDKWEVLRKMCANGAPDDVMELYLEKCRATGCDPFERMFYVVGRRDSRTNQMAWTMQSSIDLLRSIANSEPDQEYAGQLGPFWTGDGEKWVDVWLAKELPVACKIAILRKSFKEPMWVTVTMAYYKPSAPSNFWSADKAPFQLAKCAESLALRKAFPKRMHGLYSDAEMDQATHGTRSDERPEAIEASFTPQNPVQAVLAKRAREKAGDSPDARALGISAIQALYSKRGLEPPGAEAFDGCTVEQLREIFATTKEAQEALDAPARAESHAEPVAGLSEPALPLEAVSRPLPPPLGGPGPSQASTRKLFALLNDLGVKDKDERISWACGFGGSLAMLNSFADLSQAQTGYLIERAEQEVAG